MNNLTSWLWEVTMFTPQLWIGIARKTSIKFGQTHCQSLLAVRRKERNGCKFLTLWKSSFIRMENSLCSVRNISMFTVKHKHTKSSWNVLSVHIRIKKIWYSNKSGVTWKHWHENEEWFEQSKFDEQMTWFYRKSLNSVFFFCYQNKTILLLNSW